MKDIKIGLAGFGTVGRGTWELLEKNKKKIEKSSKIKISVVAIADPDKNKFESVDIPSLCHLHSDALCFSEQPPRVQQQPLHTESQTYLL